MAPNNTVWPLDPHTAAKHEILRRYLGAWFPIITAHNNRVLYIDGFCGPGKYAGGEDGSPILAIKTAMQHENRLRGKQVIFHFMDERVDRIDHLKSQLNTMTIPNYVLYKLYANQFAPTIRRTLDWCDANNMRLVPTFAFIDPFGFGELPFELVRRLLHNPKTEVFINIMADSVNRFLTHPDAQIQNHIVELFGTPLALDIAHTSHNRIVDLRLLYQEQLKTCARFVRYFEMKNDRNRTIYYLFFAGNNALGHEKMKEAFWSVDRTSGFSFSDATDGYQPLLFDINDTPRQLATEINSKFAGQCTRVSIIKRYVIDETPFLERHMRGALKLLEEAGTIKVESVKTDGKKRVGKTFPDEVVLNF